MCRGRQWGCPALLYPCMGGGRTQMHMCTCGCMQWLNLIYTVLKLCASCRRRRGGGWLLTQHFTQSLREGGSQKLSNSRRTSLKEFSSLCFQSKHIRDPHINSNHQWMNAWIALGFTPPFIHTFGGFLFFLPPASQQLQKIWRNNIMPISQLRKLRFLKKVTYLPKLTSSGIYGFPGCSLVQFSLPHKWRTSSRTRPQDQGSGQGCRMEGLGVHSPDAFTSPFLIFTMLWGKKCVFHWAEEI